MTHTTRPAVDRLLHGIATEHVETARDAWREALHDPAPALAQVLDKLASSAWAENPRGPLHKYFGVLLALLDELDPCAFQQEIARLRATNLHPVHTLTLDILAQRAKDRPATVLADGTPVFIARDIADHQTIIRFIERWSRTRGVCLDQVSRISVIARHPVLDYLGSYDLYFSGIVLTWPADPAKGIKLWWRGLDTEFTFYHELGHHICGHVEGGQVADQEREADDYARAMLRRSRPVFTLIAGILLLPFQPLKKHLIAYVERKRAVSGKSAL